MQALEIYGAFRRLVERYQLAGVSVRCFDLLTLVKNTGCLGLALLNANGIFGGCEADLPTLLSMSILGTVSGQHAFQCNPSRVDRAANEIVFAHCTLPLDMPEKYHLGTHFESKIGFAGGARGSERKSFSPKPFAALEKEEASAKRRLLLYGVRMIAPAFAWAERNGILFRLRIVDVQQLVRLLRQQLLIERLENRVVLRRFDKRLAVCFIKTFGACIFCSLRPMGWPAPPTQPVVQVI